MHFRPSSWLFAAAVVLPLLSLVCPARGQTVKPEWEPLFNGKDLTGWYLFLQKAERNFDPERVVTVENGMIHAYKHHRKGAQVPMGYIGTERTYSDYHFKMSYKWGGRQFEPRYIKKPDGGIYYHHAGADLIWPQALQCQVEINGVGDLIAVGRPHRTRVDSWADPRTASLEWAEFLPPEKGGVPFTTTPERGAYIRTLGNYEQDGWNTVEVIVRGDEGAHIVNGHVVNRFRNARRQDPGDPKNWLPLIAGKILLEFEATEIFYRDIQIRSLGATETLDQAIRLATAQTGRNPAPSARPQ